MQTRTALQLAHGAVTVALGWEVVAAWRELRVLRKWIIADAVDIERIEQVVRLLREHGGVNQVRVRRHAP